MPTIPYSVLKRKLKTEQELNQPELRQGYFAPRLSEYERRRQGIYEGGHERSVAMGEEAARAHAEGTASVMKAYGESGVPAPLVFLEGLIGAGTAMGGRGPSQQRQLHEMTKAGLGRGVDLGVEIGPGREFRNLKEIEMMILGGGVSGQERVEAAQQYIKARAPTFGERSHTVAAMPGELPPEVGGRTYGPRMSVADANRALPDVAATVAHETLHERGWDRRPTISPDQSFAGAMADPVHRRAMRLGQTTQKLTRKKADKLGELEPEQWVLLRKLIADSKRPAEWERPTIKTQFRPPPKEIRELAKDLRVVVERAKQEGGPTEDMRVYGDVVKELKSRYPEHAHTAESLREIAMRELGQLAFSQAEEIRGLMDELTLPRGYLRGYQHMRIRSKNMRTRSKK